MLKSTRAVPTIFVRAVPVRSMVGTVLHCAEGDAVLVDRTFAHPTRPNPNLSIFVRANAKRR
jgi:hypothetical protein